MKESKDSNPKVFKIPALFGMHPGLVVILAVVLAFILLGIIPSLFKTGRRVTFDSNYYPFAIEIDDKDMYMLDSDVYLKSGRHDLVVRFNDKVIHEQEIRVRPAFFYTWLIEGRQKIKIRIDEAKIDSIEEDVIKFFLEDAVKFSTFIEEGAAYPVRPIFSNLETMLGQERLKKHKNTIEEALRLTSNSALVRDASLLNLKANELDPSQNLRDVHTRNGSHNKALERDNLLWLTGIGSDGFYVQEGETTEFEWQRFISENVYWDRSNLETLIANGDADEDYMRDFTGSKDKVVRNVSPRAVRAYTKWLSEKALVEVRLPSRYELLNMSYVYDTFDKTLEGANPSEHSFLGGVWEMTSTVFEPQYLTDGKRTEFKMLEKYGVEPAIELFGGSAYNSKYDDDELRSLVGVMHKSETSKAAGFRVCWSKVKE